MVNRIKFFESVNGIQYPDMIIKFFDHFLALRYLVEDKGIIDINHKLFAGHIGKLPIFPAPLMLTFISDHNAETFLITINQLVEPRIVTQDYIHSRV